MIQQTMQASTAKVNGAEALGVFDALSLQDTAQSLVASVNATMKDLAAKKPQLDMLGVTQVAVQSIQDQKTASKALGDAIVSKVPGVGQGIAQGSIDQINAALADGIKALSAPGAGGQSGGSATGGTMSGGGGGRNSSSNGTSASGRNSTSGNGGTPALNPAQPADAGDSPSMSSARVPNMMTSTATAAMPDMMTSAMPGMMNSATTTAMAATTMMTGSPMASSMMVGSGATGMSSSPVALIGGLALVAAMGLF